jgi:hypothetical protein
MGELSPAAQAVLWAGLNRDSDRLVIAAALQAAAAHLLREKSWSLGVRWSADELQSIARELES